MDIEYLVQVKLTEREMVNAVLDQLEMEMNDEVPGSEKYERLFKIVESARNSGHTCIDTDGDDFVLMVDGVAITEEL